MVFDRVARTLRVDTPSDGFQADLARHPHRVSERAGGCSAGARAQSLGHSGQSLGTEVSELATPDLITSFQLGPISVVSVFGDPCDPGWHGGDAGIVRISGE